MREKEEKWVEREEREKGEGRVGTVVPSIAKMSWRKVLPCFGAGYRWEFKKRSNVRLDFGIGRGETSFIFNINEAF